MLESVVTSLSSLLRIGIASNGISLLRSSGWPQRTHQILAEESIANGGTLTQVQLAALLEKLIQAANCDGLNTEFILADELVRLFMVTPPLNCSRLDDCRAAAHMRFQALYGEGAKDWYIEAEWDPQFPFLACAMPRALRADLLKITQTHHLTIKSLLPNFISTWNRWHRQLISDAWFGMVINKNMTLAIVDQGRLCGVRTAPLPDQAWSDPQWLPDYVSREALRMNVPAITTLQVSGSFPAHWIDNKVGPVNCIKLDGNQPAAVAEGQSVSLFLAQSGLKI